MRVVPAVLAAFLFAAGCGGGGRETSTPALPSSETLEALLARPGDDVALNLGAGDLQKGPVRLSFLVIRDDGQPVSRPTARVWIGRTLKSKPFAETTARLEDVGVPGESEAAIGDVTKLYVARFSVPQAGRYFVVAEPVGGSPIQGVADLTVRTASKSPPVGSKAIASNTPTIASTGGDLGALTTRNPPDRALLRYSVADSLRAHVPFVLVFATPKFCASRTCGPVVDVVDAVRKRLARSGVRFIHVEIYEGDDPSNGVNRWVKEWRLPSEPWVFLVGRDGLIKAKFEGSVSVGELTAAVRRYLL